MHHLQALDLFHGLFFHFPRHLRLLYLVQEFRALIVGLFHLAEFRLDGLHLFPQEVFPLGLVHLFLGLCLDLGLHLGNLKFLDDIFADPLKPPDGIKSFENALALRYLESKVRRHKVREPPRVLQVVDDHHNFLEDDLSERGELFELLPDVTHHRLDLKGNLGGGLLLYLRYVHHIGRLCLREPGYLRSREALQKYLYPTVG